MGKLLEKYKNVSAEEIFKLSSSFSIGKSKVYNDDCFNILPFLKKNSADMILTDAPYGISNNVKIFRKKNKKKFKQTSLITHDFGKWDYFPSTQDFLDFSQKWVDLCVNLLRPGGVFITFFDRDSINFISHYLQQQHNFKIKGYFSFIKTNPVPQARKVKFMNAWEVAGIWQKPGGKLTFNYQYGQQPDYVFLPICSGNERTKHPTQKPLKLMYPFIRYFTNPGDLIIDPFGGSGTTAVACRNLGRQCITIEREAEYYNIIKHRLKDFKICKINEKTNCQLGLQGL